MNCKNECFWSDNLFASKTKLFLFYGQLKVVMNILQQKRGPIFEVEKLKQLRHRDYKELSGRGKLA